MKKVFVKAVAWFAILALVFTSLALFAGCGVRSDEEKKEVELTIWGTYETSDIVGKIIGSFVGEKAYKKWKINYKKIPFERLNDLESAQFDNTYEELLMSEIAAGEGPDIFMAHNTWFTKHKDKMVEITEDPAVIASFEETYVPAATQDLIVDGDLMGFPLYVDTLALYYNPKYFRATDQGRPAPTWDGLIAQITDVEIRDTSQGVLAFALGTTNNISRASDIVLNFALQAGYDSTYELNPLTLSALKENPLELYTRFADRIEKSFVWDKTQDYYVDEFVDGNVAAIVGYQYLDKEIQKKAGLGFGYDVAPLPQLDLRNPVVIANYWAPAISRNAEMPAEALTFLQYWAETANDAYLDETGKPPAQFRQIALLKNDDKIGVFSEQSKIARTFPVWSDVRYATIISEAIDAVNEGSVTAREGVRLLENAINRFLSNLASSLGEEE